MIEQAEKISEHLQKLKSSDELKNELEKEIEALILTYVSKGEIKGAYNIMQMLLVACGTLAATIAINLSVDRDGFVGFDYSDCLRFMEGYGQYQFKRNIRQSTAAIILDTIGGDIKK